MKPYFKLRSDQANKADKRGKKQPLIYLWVFDPRFTDRKFKYSTKMEIDPHNWKDGKAKANKSLSPIESARLVAINEHLKKLRNAVEKFETLNLSATSIDKEELRTFIEDYMDDKKEERAKKAEEAREAAEKLQKQNDFFNIWQNIIDTAKNPKTGQKVTGGTKRSKVQTLTKVAEYCATNKIKPALETIDMTFYHGFDKYMESEGLNPNTRGKHIKELKAFLRECADRDYDVNTSYTKKSFKVIRVPVDDIYLTEDQLKDLLGLEDLTAAQKYLRDIFVAACYVGQRHSDWHQIRQENVEVINGIETIRIKQQKSGGSTIVHVPLHPIVKKILKKYGGQLPKVITNQKFNEQLKKIAEKAKIKGILKTHTARRSFCTNAYLSGMDVHQIMTLSGHRSESSFLRYLKLEGRDFAIKAASHEFFRPKSKAA